MSRKLDWRVEEIVSTKYDLDIGYRTVYTCHSNKPEQEIITELRKNFAYLMDAGQPVQIFKTIKSRIK